MALGPRDIISRAEITEFEAGRGVPSRYGDNVLLDLRHLGADLIDRKLRIALTQEVVDWIIEATCKDRSYGARPLRRAIQRYVEDPLSEELIRGHLRGGEIEVYLEAGQLAYRPAGELEAGRKLA